MAEAKTYEELKPLVEEEGEGILITHADCEKAWSLKELFPGEEPKSVLEHPININSPLFNINSAFNYQLLAFSDREMHCLG